MKCYFVPACSFVCLFVCLFVRSFVFVVIVSMGMCVCVRMLVCLHLCIKREGMLDFCVCVCVCVCVSCVCVNAGFKKITKKRVIYACIVQCLLLIMSARVIL